MHRAQGFDAPQACVGAQAIRDVLADTRRTNGVRRSRKRAAYAGTLRDMLHGIEGDTPRAVHDWILLAIGVAGAYRRSELVTLEFNEVAMAAEGIQVLVSRLKTYQESAGVEIAIPEGTRLRPNQLPLDRQLR